MKFLPNFSNKFLLFISYSDKFFWRTYIWIGLYALCDVFDCNVATGNVLFLEMSDMLKFENGAILI